MDNSRNPQVSRYSTTQQKPITQTPARRSSAAQQRPQAARYPQRRRAEPGAIWARLLSIASALLALIILIIGLWFGIQTLTEFNVMYGIVIVLIFALAAISIFAAARLQINIWRRNV